MYLVSLASAPKNSGFLPKKLKHTRVVHPSIPQTQCTDRTIIQAGTSWSAEHGSADVMSIDGVKFFVGEFTDPRSASRLHSLPVRAGPRVSGQHKQSRQQTASAANLPPRLLFTTPKKKKRFCEHHIFWLESRSSCSSLWLPLFRPLHLCKSVFAPLHAGHGALFPVQSPRRIS